MNSPGVAVDTPARRLNATQAGLVKAGPGAPRLLAELVRRGLQPDDLKVAAALVLELEEQARP
jgi:hypothetical protein